jgi:hypothetical protein
VTTTPGASQTPPWIPERLNHPLVLAHTRSGERVAVALFRGGHRPRLTVHDAHGALLAAFEGHGTTYGDHGDEHVPVGGDREVEVSALAFAPDGALLASGDEMGAVLVWDARPAPWAARVWWRMLAPPRRPPVAHHTGLGGRILSLAWSDSRLVVEVGGDTPHRVEIDVAPLGA